MTIEREDVRDGVVRMEKLAYIKDRFIKRGIWFLVLGVVFGIVPVLVEGANLYVPGSDSTVQSPINAANPGDIYVTSGTYTEAIYINKKTVSRGRQQLIEAVEDLKQTFLYSINDAVQNVALSYALFTVAAELTPWWKELARLTLDTIHAVLGTIMKIVDFLTPEGSTLSLENPSIFHQIIEGLKKSNNILGEISVIQGLVGLYRNADSYKLSFEAISNIEKRAREEYKISKDFNKVSNVVQSELWLPSTPDGLLIFLKTKTSLNEGSRLRNTVLVNGVMKARDKIVKSFDDFISQIPDPLPANYPVDEAITYIHNLKQQIAKTGYRIVKFEDIGSDEKITRHITLGMTWEGHDATLFLHDKWINNLLNVQYTSTLLKTGETLNYIVSYQAKGITKKISKGIGDLYGVIDIIQLPSNIVNLISKSIHPLDALQNHVIKMNMDLVQEISNFWTLCVKTLEYLSPKPVITKSLEIIPQQSSYSQNQTIQAKFTITNKGTAPIILKVITVRGCDPDGCVSDFTFRENIELKPNVPYEYQGNLTLTKKGVYHFFCAYNSKMTWECNIPTEANIKNTLDITVKELPSITPADEAKFVKDVTIPDGTAMLPGQGFKKTWRIKNAGNTTWGSGYTWNFVSGNKMFGPSFVSISQSISPGNTYDVSVDLVAPNTTGLHRGYWQMNNSDGMYFGDKCWVEIVVGTKTTPSEGELIKQEGDTKIYLVRGGRKWWIINDDIFQRLGFNYSKVKAYPLSIINSYENGPNIVGNSSLIRRKGTDPIFLIENNKRRWITSPSVFTYYGFKWEDVYDVPYDKWDSLIALLPQGLNLIIPVQTDITAPSVSIFSPSGGESLTSGTQKEIRWNATDNVGVSSINLYYTTDRWLSLTKINTSPLSNTGSYIWTVPPIVTSQVSIRVVAYDSGGNIGYANSNLFAIASPYTLPPETPYLYEPGIYTGNSYYTIYWQDVSEATNYTLQESRDSSFNFVIEYSPNVREKFITGKENGIYYYRVKANNAGGSSGWSNVVDIEVRVNTPPYTPSNPNPYDGATNILRRPALSWIGGDPDGTCDYAILFGKDPNNMGCVKGFNSENTSPTYQFNYDLEPETTYYWQIRAKDNNGIDTWGPTWRFTTAYSYADLVPISLVANGTIAPKSQATLTLVVKNQGTYPAPGAQVLFYYSSSSGAKEQEFHWNRGVIPELAPGQQTTISQTITIENLKVGKSYIDAWINTQNYFTEGDINNNTISYEINYIDNNPPVISYLALQWGFFKTGQEYPIVFNACDDIGVKTVDFYYSIDNGSTWEGIITGFVVGSNGIQNGYWWKIPSDCPLTDQLKIKMIAWDTEINSAEAIAGPYKIRDGTPPVIRIISPNGGEIWNLGSQQEIKWEVSAPNGISRMSLSLWWKDKGEHIADITSNTTGVYIWELPISSYYVTNGARIKIKIEDLNTNCNEDLSDSYFTINDPSLPPPLPWQMPEKITTITTTNANHYNPVVATDKFSNLHLVYKYCQDDSSGNTRTIRQEILYKKLSNGSWSNPAIVYSLIQNTDGNMTGYHSIVDLQIAVDSNNYPHIVWTNGISSPITYWNQSDIFYTYFNGSNWTTPMNISSPATPLDFTWTTKASMPEAKSNAASGVINGKIYVFGGNYRMSNYEYDPINNLWTRKADLPYGISEGGAGVINNKIYAVGDPFYNYIQIYDPLNDSWNTGATIPTPRRGMGVCAVQGKLYAIGGVDSGLNPYNTVEEYNPVTDSWTTKKPMPTPRGYPAIAVVNNLIYVFGGSGEGYSLNTVEVYDPSNDTWITKTSMPTRRRGAVACVINGKIYVIGGSEYKYLNVVEEYNPSKDRWLSRSSMPTARAWAVSEVIGNKIYVIGGGNENNYSLSVVEEGILTGEDIEETVSGSPKIAIDSSNNIHIIWTDGYSMNSDFTQNGKANIYHRSKNSFGQWSSIKQITTGGASGPSIALDKNDNLHLVYKIYPSNIAYIKWDKTTWSSPMTVTTFVEGLIDISSDSNNNLHIVWYYYDSSLKQQQILYSHYNGNNWSLPEEVSDRIPGQSPFRPSIVVDSLNNPHIIWEESGNGRLMYKRKTQEGWSLSIQLNLESQYVADYSNDATISPNNQIYTIWTSNYSGHQEVFCNHCDALATITDTTPPIVNLVTPTGGESLSIGSTYTITWNASDNSGVASITLKYSINDEATLADIAIGINNSGKYEWAIPNIGSCSVRIWVFAYDAYGNIGKAVSRNFSISDSTSPLVFIIKPTGGEIWEGGSYQEILWQATDNVAVSKIDLFYSMDDGKSWNIIAKGTSNTGLYLWAVANVSSQDCFIKVIGYDEAGYFGEAICKGSFTIKQANHSPIVPHSPIPIDKAINVDASLTLTWQGGDIDNDTVLYDVYFGTNSSPSLALTKQLQTSFNPGTLSQNITYYWYIVASDGKTSTLGALWSFTTGKEAMKTPRNLRADSVSSNEITLVWDYDLSNISGFRIERKIGTEGAYNEITQVPGSITFYKDFQLLGNTEYVYRIRAFSKDSFSEYSSELWVKTPNTPPYLSNLLPLDGSANQPVNIALSWFGQDADYNDQLTYNLYFGEGFNPPLALFGMTRTTYSLEGLDYNKRYFWRVVAIDSMGDFVSSPLFSFITTNESKPNPPANPETTVVSSSQIDLQWMDNSDNEDGFIIERKISYDDTYSIVSYVDANTTKFSDIGLIDGLSYFYRIRAFNSSGDSYSGEVSAITSDPPPAIISLNPWIGTQNITSTITITGNYFQDGATVKFKKDTSEILGQASIVEPTTITCSFNLASANTGWWDLVVTNPDGQSGILTKGFLVNASVGIGYWSTIDEHDKLLPAEGHQYYYNWTGGDRGLLNDEDIDYSWDGNSIYIARVEKCTGLWTWGGMWYSLNRINRDNIPLNFEAIFGPYVKPEYQGEIIEIEIVVSNATSTSNNTNLELRLELKDVNDVKVYSKSWTDLIPGSYPRTYTVSLDLTQIGNIKLLLWVIDRAQIGDSVSIDRVRLKAKVPNMPTEEQAFLWTYSWLLANYDPNTGMVQDRSNFGSGDFENVPATAKTAKIVYYAYKKGYTTYEDAKTITTKIANTLINVVPQGPAGKNSLWPHFTGTGGTQIIPNTEWPSGDTAYAGLDIITALQMLGDPENQMNTLVNFLENIDWEDLLLEDGGISHGYSFDGNLLPDSWKGFGMENIGVNWAYAASCGKVVKMESPPSDNGSGFIDNACYPMIFSGVDSWGNDWDAYRESMTDRQIEWYSPSQHYNQYLWEAGLFGLSAAETPEGDRYEAYGVGGKYYEPNDGNGEIVVLHYSGMIADIRKEKTKRMWEYLLNAGIISPLNNMESMRVNKNTGTYTINHLKGSWNLALQAEGWAMTDTGVKNELISAIQNNTFLKKGYDLLKTPRPNVNISKKARNITQRGIGGEYFDPELYLEGHTIEFAILVENIGLGTATNVVVTDTLPDGITYNGIITGKGKDDSNAPNLKWNIETIIPNTSETLSFQVTVNK